MNEAKDMRGGVCVTEWEEKFVMDVKDRIERYPLSEKQIITLNHIFDKAAGHFPDELMDFGKYLE